MEHYHFEGPNRIFKVHVYNTDVRAKIKENHEHEFFSEQWADGQFILIQASDRDEMKQIISSRYPPNDGFVIESAIEIN